MKSLIKLILGFAALVIAILTPPTFGYDARGFPDGNRFYQAGDYDGAEKLYRGHAGDGEQFGQVSPGLLHNLGNAEYKLGKLGPAILAWERARALDPAFRNTAANLRFARGQAGLNEPEFAWHEVYSALLAPDAWLWIATAAFWVTVGLLTLPALLKQKRTGWTQGGAVVAIAVFLLTLPALAGIMTRGKLGVVLATETLLRLTPTKEGEMLGKLAEGELARVEKARGEYVYVRGANDRAGWVLRGEFTKIWP